jgi:hypothetical protein
MYLSDRELSGQYDLFNKNPLELRYKSIEERVTLSLRLIFKTGNRYIIGVL